jgi:hypothetical protein
MYFDHLTNGERETVNHLLRHLSGIFGRDYRQPETSATREEPARLVWTEPFSGSRDPSPERLLRLKLRNREWTVTVTKCRDEHGEPLIGEATVHAGNLAELETLYRWLRLGGRCPVEVTFAPKVEDKKPAEKSAVSAGPELPLAASAPPAPAMPDPAHEPAAPEPEKQDWRTPKKTRTKQEAHAGSGGGSKKV